MESLLLPAATLSAILALFVAYSVLVSVEDRRGGRLVARRLRYGLDYVVGKLSQRSRSAVGHLGTLRIYADNRATDPSVANAVFRHATRTPLTVTHTDNHLSKMREHKIETALTPAEKRKLNKKKLEERF